MRIRGRHLPEAIGVLAFLAAIGGGCAYTVFAEAEPLSFDAPPGRTWELAYSAPFDVRTETLGADGRIDEYVPAGDDVESWTELLTILRTYKMMGQSKRDSYERLQEIREEECPESTRWNLVEESDERLIYESWAKPCLGFPDQYELAVFIDGTRDRVKLSYAVKAEDVEPGVRRAWLETMRSAKLGGERP